MLSMADTYAFFPFLTLYFTQYNLLCLHKILLSFAILWKDWLFSIFLSSHVNFFFPVDHLINESLMPTLGLVHQLKATGKLLKKINPLSKWSFCS